ncbi:MAG: SCO family protein [Proteobacteria bacterium]|nr:SCO family protein [Pseudomonadota bacterium]
MPRITTRRFLVVAAMVAAFAGFWAARQLDRESPRLASGTWLPVPQAITPFTLTGADGRPFTLADLRGAPTLVFFGFTHCPDVCPTTLLQLAQVRRQADVPGLRVLFVSVDPQRDTPALLAAYLHAFDRSFLGATGDMAQLAAVQKDFGVAVSRVELPGGDYTMDHSATVFLLDAGARRVAVFSPPFDTAAFSADLRSAAPWLKRGGTAGSS